MGLTGRLLALCFAALLASCGGGGGDGGGGGGTPPPAGMSGTWFGTLEDADVALWTASITIAGGAITQVLQNGVDTGLTGTVTQQSTGVMRYTLTDGSGSIAGVFLVDASLTHMAFADEGANFGVLQKNASSPLPSYVYNTDLNGAWTGMGLLTDFTSFFTEASSTASCAFSSPTVTCTVTNPAGTFPTTLSGAFDTTFGRWTGTYTGPTNGSSNVLLSADKTFAAAWACDNPDQFWPDDCAFYALHR